MNDDVKESEYSKPFQTNVFLSSLVFSKSTRSEKTDIFKF